MKTFCDASIIAPFDQALDHTFGHMPKLAFAIPFQVLDDRIVKKLARDLIAVRSASTLHPLAVLLLDLEQFHV